MPRAARVGATALPVALTLARARSTYRRDRRRLVVRPTKSRASATGTRMSDVPGPRRQSLLLPKDVPASRTARSALGGWLSCVDRPTVDAARSIVTELVANAVRFGGRRSG